MAHDAVSLVEPECWRSDKPSACELVVDTPDHLRCARWLVLAVEVERERVGELVMSEGAAEDLATQLDKMLFWVSKARPSDSWKLVVEVKRSVVTLRALLTLSAAAVLSEELRRAIDEWEPNEIDEPDEIDEPHEHRATAGGFVVADGDFRRATAPGFVLGGES